MAEWTIEWNNQAIKNNPNFEVDGITIFKISDTIYNIDELSAARVMLSDGTESITISCIGVTNIANGVTSVVFADSSYQLVVVAAIVSENSSDYEPGLYVGDVLEGTNLDITMSYTPATFCLYNGVKLPDVNTVWNKEKYPYAFIVTEIVDNITTAWLYLTANPVYIAPIAPDLPGLQIPAGGYAQYICVDSLDAAEINPYAGYNYWKASILTGDNATSFNAPKDGEAAWSNHDVYNADGALYLAASNPILVGGSLTFTIDKASFLAGYKVGAELRRLRLSGGGHDYPALPSDLDTTTYPYLCIFSATEEDKSYMEPILGFELGASLLALSKPLYVSGDDIRTDVGDATSSYAENLDTNSWYYLGGSGGSDSAYTSTLKTDVIWTNTDILNEDGSIFMAATPYPG